MSSNRPSLTSTYRTVLLSVIFVVSLMIFSWIAHEVVIEQEDIFDSIVFSYFKAYSGPFYIEVFEAFTFLGSSIFLLSAYTILIILLFIKKRKRDALGFACLGIAGFLLVYFLKLAFARHRPDEPVLTALENFSFPSGHAVGSLVFFGALTWELWQTNINKSWKWVLTMLFTGTVLMVGFSRIVLRYHYPSDVLGGFCLGIALLMLFLFLFTRKRKKEWPLLQLNPDKS